jgi:SAM-dependent methyltransferase
MPILDLPTYVKHVGMDGDYRTADTPCEVCGSPAFSIIREAVLVNEGLEVALKVVACDVCGFLFQTPRFDAGFYDAYYNSHYRRMLSGWTVPSEEFIEDQITRGEFLFTNLSPILPAPGRMLDVGCSSGGIMHVFLKYGWTAFGTDPDAGYVEYGRARLHAPVQLQRAEDMDLEPGSFDLVVITGSLEHVFDPNRVMAICHRAAKPGALLVLEGRGLAQARQVGHCSHNHRRYLTLSSIELIMRKHGWEPLVITDEQLCGPTRPQSSFGIGAAGAVPEAAEFQVLVSSQNRETSEQIRADFDRWKIR